MQVAIVMSELVKTEICFHSQKKEKFKNENEILNKIQYNVFLPLDIGFASETIFTLD